MAKSEDKSQTIVIVYPRNTIEITMGQECADQLLAHATKSGGITSSREFSGVDINGHTFSVQVGSPALAVYAKSQEEVKVPTAFVLVHTNHDLCFNVEDVFTDKRIADGVAAVNNEREKPNEYGHRWYWEVKEVPLNPA